MASDGMRKAEAGRQGERRRPGNQQTPGHPQSHSSIGSSGRPLGNMKQQKSGRLLAAGPRRPRRWKRKSMWVR